MVAPGTGRGPWRLRYAAMLNDLEIALVSNRGPVSFIAVDDDFDTKRGAGGLAGALDPVARRLGDRAIWIAAATSDTDRRAVRSGKAGQQLQELLGYRVTLLDIKPEVYSRYYNEVSNRMLWFANHCLWDELNIRDFGERELSAWSEAYEPVNRMFAEAVAERTGPDSVVLFQDYHLATAPGHLRALRRDQTIFHFTHSSFCGPNGLERLPKPIARQTLEGMLGADLLGFHVTPWADNFFGCCERIGATVDRRAGVVEHEGRHTWVRAYPIAIDPTDLKERAAGELARKWAARFREGASDSLVVRADRSEPSKNIVRGFEAFGVLLDRRPDLAGTARFIACLYPSRQAMPEYARYVEEIEATVDRINVRHPNSIQLFMKDDYDRTIGALCVYDVLLVNSIMDGMNLVSMEGPSVNERDGVLVLSSGAGSFGELGNAAVTIEDPLDVEQTALALEIALDMAPQERSKRAERLRELVVARKPENWIDAQLNDLVAIQKGRAPLTQAP
jgi:trehalose 6-phosphate synthase